MKEEKDLRTRRGRPSVTDQLVVLLMSVGMGLLVLLVGIAAGRLVALVFWLITAFTVVTINVLFAFSHWEKTTGTEQRAMKDSGSGGCEPKSQPQRTRKKITHNEQQRRKPCVRLRTNRASSSVISPSKGSVKP